MKPNINSIVKVTGALDLIIKVIQVVVVKELVQRIEMLYLIQTILVKK